MLNRIEVIGRVGRDPEMRYTPDGTPVASFSVGVNIGEKTDWFDVVTWKKQAEACNQYVKKGMLVHVEGQARLRSWDKDGEKHSKMEIQNARVLFLSKSEKTEKPDRTEADLFE